MALLWRFFTKCQYLNSCDSDVFVLIFEKKIWYNYWKQLLKGNNMATNVNFIHCDANMVKFGFDRKGQQRYKCMCCGKTSKAN